jgi:hypothetical protein
LPIPNLHDTQIDSQYAECVIRESPFAQIYPIIRPNLLSDYSTIIADFVIHNRSSGTLTFFPYLEGCLIRKQAMMFGSSVNDMQSVDINKCESIILPSYTSVYSLFEKNAG